ELLDAKDDNTRYYAIQALGWVGPAAKSTAPKIIAALSDKNDSVRRKAAYTLSQIAADPDTAIAELSKVLGDKAEDVREAAADGLSKYGAKAVPTLVAVLKKDDKAGQKLAAGALGKIGAEAKSGVPALRDLLLAEKQAPDQPRWVCEALGKIGR